MNFRVWGFPCAGVNVVGPIVWEEMCAHGYDSCLFTCMWPLGIRFVSCGAVNTIKGTAHGKAHVKLWKNAEAAFSLTFSSDARFSA